MLFTVSLPMSKIVIWALYHVLYAPAVYEIFVVCRLLWRNLLSSVAPYSFGRWISWDSVRKPAEHDPHCHFITYAMQGNVFFHFASLSKLFKPFSNALLIRWCRTVFTFKFTFYWNRGFEFCVPRQSMSSAVWRSLYGSHMTQSEPLSVN